MKAHEHVTSEWDHLAGEHPQCHLVQGISALLFALVWLVDNLILNLTTFLNDVVPNAVRVPIGLVLVILAGYLGWASHRTVVSHPDEPRVVREGVYGWVRHPLYLSELLVYLGLLAFGLSLAAMAVWLGVFIAFNHIAIYEEQRLLERFGDDYARYKREVLRWLLWPPRQRVS